jgi:flavin-dependent dehydrogenase
MKWDVIVVGAGPAGAVAARELARRGRRVLLVDKAIFPRMKVCGCCLNSAAIRTLERLGLAHVLEGAIPLDRVRIAAGAHSADVNLPRGMALSREVLDARLVEAAIEAGAEFRPGTTVKRDSPLLAQAPVVVIASGLSSKETSPAPGSRIGAGVILPAGAAPGVYDSRTIHMATGRGGYVGLVRVEEDRLDIAAAFDANFVKSSGGLGLAAKAILRQVCWPIPSDLVDAPWRGTPALTRQRARLAERGLFVVGDAAGYIEPFTGEGMAWAMMSARAIAPIVDEAVRSWDDGLARLWEATHRRIIGRRQRVCRVVAQVLRSARLTGIAVRVLRRFPIVSRPVVAAIN